MVGIIDYGLGNLGSIQNMLKVIGEKSIISSNPDILNTCDRFKIGRASCRERV